MVLLLRRSPLARTTEDLLLPRWEITSRFRWMKQMTRTRLHWVKPGRFIRTLFNVKFCKVRRTGIRFTSCLNDQLITKLDHLTFESWFQAKSISPMYYRFGSAYDDLFILPSHDSIAPRISRWHCWLDHTALLHRCKAQQKVLFRSPVFDLLWKYFMFFQ